MTLLNITLCLEGRWVELSRVYNTNVHAYGLIMSNLYTSYIQT